MIKKDFPNVLCTICARGGSKGVVNKNIKLLNNKPLIAYSIQQAKDSEIFDHVIISTDSDEIAEISLKYGAEVFFLREKHLATDESGKIEVIRDALLKSEMYYDKVYDFIIDLDATSPLRNPSDINLAFKQFIESKQDNLVSAMPSRRNPYFNMLEINEKGELMISKSSSRKYFRRQDSPLCYDMNASIYIWKRNSLLYNSELISNRTTLYIMPEERSIDIDSELDFKIVEYLIKLKNA